MDSYTVTLTGRVLDGFIAANNDRNINNPTPGTLSDYITEQVEALGRNMADSRQIGKIIGTEVVFRVTQSGKLGPILAAAEQSPELAALIADLRSREYVIADDPLLLGGLEQLRQIGLITAEDVVAYTAYDRLTP